MKNGTVGSRKTTPPNGSARLVAPIGNAELEAAKRRQDFAAECESRVLSEIRQRCFEDGGYVELPVSLRAWSEDLVAVARWAAVLGGSMDQAVAHLLKAGIETSREELRGRIAAKLGPAGN